MLVGLFAPRGTAAEVEVDSEEIANIMTVNSALYVYNAFAAQPRPLAELAQKISQDYNRAPDEFAGWDLLKQLEPMIARKTAEAKATAKWRLNLKSKLDTYDFEKKKFPVGIDPNTRVDLGSFYRLKFANNEKLRAIFLPIEEARRHQLRIRQSRNIIIVMEYVVVGATMENGTHEIEIKATSAIVKFSDGTVLGNIAL